MGIVHLGIITGITLHRAIPQRLKVTHQEAALPQEVIAQEDLHHPQEVIAQEVHRPPEATAQEVHPLLPEAILQVAPTRDLVLQAALVQEVLQEAIQEEILEVAALVVLLAEATDAKNW